MLLLPIFVEVSGMRTWQKRVLKGFTLLLAMVAVLYAFSSGPPPGRTGGFGESTCQDCHEFGPSDNGSFAILGVPDTYTPGQGYPIMVVLSQPGQMRWGFQLAARFQADGSQAGNLSITDPDNTQILMNDSGVQYVEHTSAGTYEGTADGPVSWGFTWTAPIDPSLGTVEFDAAGNAANGDHTPSGDYIYTTNVTSGAPSAGLKPVPRR
jgi:hypothetical protein